MLPRNNVLVLLRNRGCTKDSRQQLCGLKANMTESIRYGTGIVGQADNRAGSRGSIPLQQEHCCFCARVQQPLALRDYGTDHLVVQLQAILFRDSHSCVPGAVSYAQSI